VVQEGAACRHQFDAAHTASEKRNAHFMLKVPHLAAERRVRRMQTLFRRDLHAPRLGEMPQLNSSRYIPIRHLNSTNKVIFSAIRRR
jgi:hypothetical protein